MPLSRVERERLKQKGRPEGRPCRAEVAEDSAAA